MRTSASLVCECNLREHSHRGILLDALSLSARFSRCRRPDSATIGTAKSDYGDKDVFNFSIDTLLPDQAVEQVMNSAVSLQADFEKQFDKTQYVKSDSAKSATPSSDASVPFAEPSGPVPPSEPDEKIAEEKFDLGI